jgi:hypothetical protein
MATWTDRIRLGVIDDARRRHWRERRRIVIALGLAVVAGTSAYGLAAGGAQARHAVPSPGQVTGSLRPLARSDYAYWVTPGLRAGTVSLSLLVMFRPPKPRNPAKGMGGYGTGWGAECCNSYPGAIPIIGSGHVGIAQPPGNTDPYQLDFVAAKVAAVRVGNLGTVGAQAAPRLPPGVSVAAFRTPQQLRLAPQRQRPMPIIEEPLTAVSARGEAIPARATPSTPERSTTRGGACAVSSTLDGLTLQSSTSVTAITPIPASQPGVFRSCLDDALVLNGTRLQVAILLNAHHPGQPPAALWGATAVPGHSGIVELKPPIVFRFDVDTGAPIFARRTGNAWLVVKGRPGLAPAPSAAQRIEVLDSIRITRLELRH